MATSAGRVTKERKPGTITEVIAGACDVVIANPLLVLVPILLDLYYLVGWKITAGTTFDRLQSSASGLDSADADRVADFVGSASRADLTGMVALIVPSFLSGTTSDDIYRPLDRSAIGLDNWGLLLLAIVVLVGITMVSFGVFGLWLADSGLKRERSWGERLRLGPVVGGRFVLMLLLILAAGLLLCTPLLIAMAVTSTLGIGLEGLFVSISLLIGIAIYILSYFAPDSLLVDLSGPVQALRASSNVVRRNLLVTLGFVLVSIIISVGLAEVWDRVATSAPGLAIAILANAFVGCVLWIASLLFFSERSKLLVSDLVASGGTRQSK